MKTLTRAFTLIELLVVIAIIGIMVATIYGSFGQGSAQSRDAKRKADLQELQGAVELYKQKYGRYPEGCNTAGNWSGQKNGVTYACSDGKHDYIRGNTGRTFTPEFMQALPTDPKLNGNGSGYVYATNASGTVYKIMARKTVETETVTMTHQYASCDISTSAGVQCDPHVVGRTCDVAICDRVFNANTYIGQVAKPNECDPSNIQFQTSYALWGGYATPASTFTHGTEAYRANIERLTEAIACKI